MKLSLISPSRNNLKYLKWSYNSVRKNCSINVEYCVASDYSNDGTVEWCKKISKKDKNFKFIVNDGTWFGQNKGILNRMGHCRLYDKLIEEVATGDIIMIWHADMYCAPNSIENILKIIKPQTIVSMTRIEPSLHIQGPEKIVKDFGLEPENFRENDFLKFIENQKSDKTTEGMFAPWACYKNDFLAIGGHDPLYSFQSKEDSDIFSRFILADYKSIQLWNAYVYHLTCRGSRFAPQLTTIGKESDEWLIHNRKSSRNFIRKWGSFVKHDEYLKPIIPHKFNVSFVIKHGTLYLLEALEPWCDKIYIELSAQIIESYIKTEQPNTLYDLKNKISNFSQNYVGDVIIKFDGSQLNQNRFNFITQLSDILNQITEVGDFEYDIFKVKVNQIKHYEKNLIFCDKNIK